MVASAATFPSASVLCSTKPRPSLSGLRFRIRSPNPKNLAAAPVSSRMEAAQPQTRDDAQGGAESAMKLLFVEMGVGYDQHGQDITAAAVRACKDAITSNSIPAFRGGKGKNPPSAVHCSWAFRRTCRHAKLTLFWLWAAPAAGSIPGVNTDQMKLQIKLGVPRSTQHLLDAERVKAVFP